MDTHRTSLVLGPAEGEALWFGGTLTMVKAAAKQTAGAYSLIEDLAPNGEGTPLHRHREDDEAFYVLEGELTFRLKDELFTRKQGELAFAPRGVPHTFANPGDADARTLIVCTPAGFERYFEELARVLPAGGLPDLVRISEIAGRYGLTLRMERVPELLKRHSLTLG